MAPHSFLFIFHAASRGMGSNNFRDSSYKEKTAGLVHVSRHLYVSYDYGLNLGALSIVLKNQQQLKNSCIDKNNESILEEIYLFHDRPRNLTIPNNHQRLSRVFLRSLAKKTGHGVNVLIKVLRLFNTWVLIKCGNIFGS